MKVGLRDAGDEIGCGWRSRKNLFLIRLEEAAWRSSGVIVLGGVQKSCGCDIWAHALVGMVTD